MTSTTKEKPVFVGPILPAKRIISLDALRGVAIMGVLAANIQIFSMIKAAEFNPTAFGDMTGINYVIAMLTHILVCRKFWTIFTMLFGAGIVLMTEKIESRGGNPAKRHYPRMIWLFVIGSAYVYIFAPAEILSYYAICGLFAYFCRKLSARKLLIYGLICLFLPSLLDISMQVRTRSPYGLEYQKQQWQPDQEHIEEELARYRGDWGDQIAYRVKTRRWFITPGFYYWNMWSFLGRMLLGMAFFKWGLLTAKARKKIFRRLLLFGLGIGLAICVSGWIFNSLVKWSYKYSVLLGTQFNTWGGLFLAVGYIAAVMLICMSGKLKRLTTRLAAVGRMALTNFLMHGIIGTFIFHGFGLGLVGKVDRYGQILIVFAIWIFQLWYSPIWLKYFRFGPAEWLWRSLTYWKLQPMKKEV